MVQPSALWKGKPQGRRKVGGTKGKPQSSRTQWARSLPLTTQPENHIALNIGVVGVFLYITVYRSSFIAWFIRLSLDRIPYSVPTPCTYVRATALHTGTPS